jgi:quinol-cytochrome oxidoreductase complex cytochrome b subunit
MASLKSKRISLEPLWNLVIDVFTVVAFLFILALYAFARIIMMLFTKPKDYGTGKTI